MNDRGITWFWRATVLRMNMAQVKIRAKVEQEVAMIQIIIRVSCSKGKALMAME